MSNITKSELLKKLDKALGDAFCAVADAYRMDILSNADLNEFTNLSRKIRDSSGLNDRRQKPTKKMTPYEKTRAEVYARGNKWQIENFEAVNGR